MGAIKKHLYQTKLPDREMHHSRLFVDLAENIHIHHREFRTVFSLNEYFEFINVLKNSTEDIRNFLTQNKDYQEGVYPTTIVIAGGKERQLQFLKNSPAPNKSAYFANEFSIELQDEFVTDEIHVHYRDFRITLNREHFKIMAKGFMQALSALEEFEKKNTYVRQSHSDRIINDFNANDNEKKDTEIMGVIKLPTVSIKSNWYKNIMKDWSPNKRAIRLLLKQYAEDGKFFPIVVSTETNGDHLIVDGHHRFYACLKLGVEEVDAIISPLSFQQTEKLRKAKGLLKEFDNDTQYTYCVSAFYKTFLAYSLNQYYRNVFSKLAARNNLFFRIMRKFKCVLLGK